MRNLFKYNERSHGHTTHIRDLFSIYKNRLQIPPKRIVVDFVEVVEVVVGIKIDPLHCRYNPNTRTITVSSSGMIRNEVLLQAPEILSTLEKRLGKKNTPQSIL